MTAINAAPIAGPVANPVAVASTSRVVSIDVFRGLTLAVMIFVNELAEVRGLPWWTYHAHSDQNAMTYVDMVFPFFLFIVGMSIPLSVEQRLRRNPSHALLWRHVLLRSLSLLVLGLILANAEKADAEQMGIRGSLWALLALLAAGLFLNVYPPSRRFPRYATALRWLGLAGVAAAFAIFRRVGHDGRIASIDPSYPEILGLIAFAYICAAALYIPARRWRWAAPASLVLLLALCIASTAKLLPFVDRLSLYAWPFGNGSHVSLVMAGVVTAQIFFGLHPGQGRRPEPGKASLAALGYALAAVAAGCLTIPLGISKIRATPAWTLWNIGAAVVAFTALYWICDQRRRTAWAAPVHAAGSNTLLTYLLPDVSSFFFAAVGVSYFETHFNQGRPGVIKAVVFTAVMLLLGSVLTRARLRLQL